MSGVRSRLPGPGAETAGTRRGRRRPSRRRGDGRASRDVRRRCRRTAGGRPPRFGRETHRRRDNAERRFDRLMGSRTVATEWDGTATCYKAGVFPVALLALGGIRLETAPVLGTVSRLDQRVRRC
ncbi:hypothetical protein GCM10027294_46530 [Marinactinospora endophytica]